MSSKAVGVFAIPRPVVAHVRELYERWSEALDRLTEDSDVLQLELFRGARERATHEVVFPASHTHWDGYIAWTSFVDEKIWSDCEQDVFSPDDAEGLLHAIEDYEGRLSRDEVLRRAAKRDLIAVEAVQPVYDAYMSVLRKAVELGAGFACAVCDEEAEEKLAAKRRAYEEASERARRRPKPTPEQVAAEEAEAQAELDRLVEKRRREYGPVHEFVPTRLYATTDHRGAGSDTVKLRRRVRRARALAATGDPDDLASAERRFDRIRGDLAEECEAQALPRTMAESDALRALGRALQEVAPAVWRDDGAYRGDQARALRGAVKAWKKARGGHRAAVGRLADAAGTTDEIAGRALRVLESILAIAANDGHGFLWLDDPTGSWDPLADSE